MSKRTPETPLRALDRYLAELQPAGADSVRAALARRLAEVLDEAPGYAVGRVAATLAALLDALDRDATVTAEEVRKSLEWLRGAA